MEKGIFEVKARKAEAGLYTMFILLALIGFFSLFSFGLWPLIAYGLLLSFVFLLVRKRFAGLYYIKIDKQGVQFRYSFFAKAAFLSWDIVDQVNFHLYEINFRLRETKQVVNIQTNYLNPDDIEPFTQLVRSYFETVVKKNNALS
jgi:hypothetical protein